TIAQALSSALVTCPTTASTYTGLAQTSCSATVTGAGGLDQAVGVSYTNNVNAGTATATASFGGDANHSSSTSSATFVISPAAPLVTATGGTFTFDGAPHAGACAVTGVGPDVLSAAPSYVPGPGVPTAVGSYTLTCTFGGSTNFTPASAAAAISIVDRRAPVLSLPATASLVATSPSGAPFAYTASATDEVDGPTPVTCAPASGSVFPIGTTTVSCTTHDAAGNAASGAFTVAVSAPTSN